MKAIILILIVILSVSFCLAQEKESPSIVDINPGACENNSAYFDMLAGLARRENERIIMIFRAGKSETEVVNAKRLNYVKNFFLKGKGWGNLNVIYARGEKTNDVGKIEFYIGGKLFLITIAPKNKTPCLDCCEADWYRPQNLLKMKKGRK